MLHVVKRDGRESRFNADKIANAIKRAANEVGDVYKRQKIMRGFSCVISPKSTSIFYFVYTI